jgi:hypothetical protein
MVFATLSEGAVEATPGNPFVHRLHANLEQRCELNDVQDGRKLRTGSVGKRLLDLSLRQLPITGAHRAARRLL